MFEYLEVNRLSDSCQSQLLVIVRDIYPGFDQNTTLDVFETIFKESE